MCFKSTGIIQYDPPRGRMKKKTSWWCVINVDREITRYYRWWVYNRYLIELAQPSWDAHISIIRGEQPKPHLKKLWKKYDGQQVEFTYNHNPRQSGDTTGFDRPDCFWFVNVQCALGTQIRKEFELPHNWSLHLTFGRTW